MGLTDFLRSQFIDIIEWNDDSRDTLSFRFPDADKEIKNGAQLIVRESQNVQFVYLGQYGDLFGPGKYTLTTDNIPVLSRLKGWKYGFESPFKADVYYLTMRLFTGNKWGTSNPIMVRDQDFGIVRVRAFGTYDFRIVDPPKFLKEVAGTAIISGSTSSPTSCDRGSSACSARRSRRARFPCSTSQLVTANSGTRSSRSSTPR
jgi:membrane protease subunit (stomatin/prohibitin family)